MLVLVFLVLDIYEFVLLVAVKVDFG
jgi:hypothetical protein